MYATVDRGHDAEWRLHQEMVTNDRMVAKARREGPPSQGATLNDLGPVPTPEPAELAAACRTVHRVAARIGAPAGDLRVVLDALGLAPELEITS